MRECGIHVVDSPAEVVKSKRSFRIVRYFKLKDKRPHICGAFIKTKLKKYICSLFKTAFTALIVTNRNDWCR
jgi:hypothetical protein